MLYQDENLGKYGCKISINDIRFLCGTSILCGKNFHILHGTKNTACNSLNKSNVLTLMVLFLDRNTGLATCLSVKLNA